MDAEKDRGKQGEFSFEHKIFNTVLEFGIINYCLFVGCLQLFNRPGDFDHRDECGCRSDCGDVVLVVGL